MKRLMLYFGCIIISLSACTTNPSKPTPNHQHKPYNPNCQRDYPKPAVTVDNLESPEMVEWANRMLECQKYQ